MNKRRSRENGKKKFSSIILQNQKRMLVFLFIFFFCTAFLIGRLGYFQLVAGSEIKAQAYEQWARDTIINAKRGVIYDSKGKKLAVSVSASTVVCYPVDIKNNSSDKEIIVEEKVEEAFLMKMLNKLYDLFNDKSDEEQKIIDEIQNLRSMDEIAGILAEILSMDKEDVYKKITSNTKYIVLKRWISEDELAKIKDAKISGVSIIDDNKRVYPYGNFASYILGFTNIDQEGQYGLEATFNKYLTGTPGRLVYNTDSKGRELPYGFSQYFDPKDGYGIVTTIDEAIQHFSEKACEEVLGNTQAKRVNLIAMDPETGDILAMASKPDYDPNNPKVPIDENVKKKWEGLSGEELQKEWFDMWRNPIVNDIYEPGSTFKPLIVAIALQENKTTLDRTYYCDGYARQIKGSNIKCWRYYNPHGTQTLAEVLQNSCNDAMVEMGLDIGAELEYKYLRALGFGEISGIALNGEAKGLLNHYSVMKDVNVATQSFGQGVSVTPLQLTAAIACLANDGELMMPRIVKQLIDENENIVKTFEPVVRRKVFSEDVADAVIEMMRQVVQKGGAKAAEVPGYSVGGKTGTAQKVIDGVYGEGVYISSFIGVAPTTDPKVVCLMTVDEPVGTYYASVIAAPTVGKMVEEIMKYMEIEPQYTEEELGAIEKETVEVPNVVGKTLKEASILIENQGLNHSVTMDVDENMIVKDQFPQAGTKVKKNSIVTIVLE